MKAKMLSEHGHALKDLDFRYFAPPDHPFLDIVRSLNSKLTAM
jgi:hypothetical protein